MERSLRKWLRRLLLQDRRFFGEPGTSATNSRGPEVEMRFPRTPSGREPLLLPGRAFPRGLSALTCPCPGGLYRLPNKSFLVRSVAGAPVLIYKPSEADVIHQPQCQKKRPDTRTAKTHERQRDACYRHDSRHHAHIHENVEEQQGRHPHT